MDRKLEALMPTPASAAKRMLVVVAVMAVIGVLIALPMEPVTTRVELAQRGFPLMALLMIPTIVWTIKWDRRAWRPFNRYEARLNRA